jgi:Transposase
MVRDQRRVIKGARWLLLRNWENRRSRAEWVRLRDLLAANRALFTVYVQKDDLKQLWRFRYAGRRGGSTVSGAPRAGEYLKIVLRKNGWSRSVQRFAQKRFRLWEESQTAQSVARVRADSTSAHTAARHVSNSGSSVVARCLHSSMTTDGAAPATIFASVSRALRRRARSMASAGVALRAIARKGLASKTVQMAGLVMRSRSP